jgi:hypothetical protein
MIDSFVTRSLARGLLPVLALMTLSQCALPPGTAWTVIRRDGIKDYMAISWRKKPVPDYVKELVPEAFGEVPKAESNEGEEGPVEAEPGLVAGDAAFPAVPGEMPEDWAQPEEPVFPLIPTDPAEVATVGAAVGAQVDMVNPLLMGPPLMTDEFAQVTLPVEVKTENGTAEAAGASAAPGLKMKDAAGVAAATAVTGHLAEGLVEVPEAEGSGAGTVGTPGLGNPIEPKVEVTGVKERESLAVVPSGSVSAALPLGVWLPGRPGYVRSPFAQAHQLVDVTGLKAGETVKCPFSDRFFRVPAEEGALNAEVKEASPLDDVVEGSEREDGGTTAVSGDKSE